MGRRIQSLGPVRRAKSTRGMCCFAWRRVCVSTDVYKLVRAQTRITATGFRAFAPPQLACRPRLIHGAEGQHGCLLAPSLLVVGCSVIVLPLMRSPVGIEILAGTSSPSLLPGVGFQGVPFAPFQRSRSHLSSPSGSLLSNHAFRSCTVLLWFSFSLHIISLSSGQDYNKQK